MYTDIASYFQSVVSKFVVDTFLTLEYFGHTIFICLHKHCSPLLISCCAEYHDAVLMQWLQLFKDDTYFKETDIFYSNLIVHFCSHAIVATHITNKSEIHIRNKPRTSMHCFSQDKLCLFNLLGLKLQFHK